MCRRLFFLAFTESGRQLAQELAEKTGGDVSLSRQVGGVQRWTERNFTRADALIYIGAAGIAVRAIAPHIQNKATDPAVLVIPEDGSFVVPILSGHLGGANALARELAKATGGVPVITTATDVSGKFAVDEWAKRQNCFVKHPERIVQVSSRILDGQEICIQSDWAVRGDAPELVRQITTCSEKGAAVTARGSAPDVVVSLYRQRQTVLHLVPRIAVLGIGCRKGTTAAQLESCFARLMEENEMEEAAVCAAASIDIKKGEPGLRAFCERRGIPLQTYPAEDLCAVEGSYTSSEFVRAITGTDNVCERSAVRSAEGGELLVAKTKYEGVTLALAVKPYFPDWCWR